MDQDQHLHSRRVVYNKEYFAFPNDRIFESKLLNRSWEYGEEHKPCDENYQRLFVWPPRFYSCNFCDREFRSAQALGGHMNVHRRDRARLRQGLHPDPNEDRTTLHAPTLERSNSRSICGYKRASISPRVCTLSPNSSVIREKDVKFLMKDDPMVSSKRRCTNPLIESQDAEVLDLELRL